MRVSPLPGQIKFYVRETRAHSLYNNITCKWDLDDNPKYGNKPIMVVWASTLEAAENAASNFIKERLGTMLAKGFVKNPNGGGYRLGNREEAYLFNVFVSHACRRCKDKAYINGMEHVKYARCFLCGSSGDEEMPVDIDTLIPVQNKTGVDVNGLEVKVSQARQQVVAREPLVVTF